MKRYTPQLTGCTPDSFINALFLPKYSLLFHATLNIAYKNIFVTTPSTGM